MFKKVSGFTICLSHQAKSDTSNTQNPTQEHTARFSLLQGGAWQARPPLGSEAGCWSTPQPRGGGEHIDRSDSGPADVSSFFPEASKCLVGRILRPNNIARESESERPFCTTLKCLTFELQAIIRDLGKHRISIACRGLQLFSLNQLQKSSNQSTSVPSKKTTGALPMF